jgi:hypothetical protein
MKELPVIHTKTIAELIPKLQQWAIERQQTVSIFCDDVKNVELLLREWDIESFGPVCAYMKDEKERITAHGILWDKDIGRIMYGFSTCSDGSLDLDIEEFQDMQMPFIECPAMVQDFIREKQLLERLLETLMIEPDDEIIDLQISGTENQEIEIPIDAA